MAEISTLDATFKFGAVSPTEVVRIKSFPSIIAPKSALEVTDLSDSSRRFIPGLRDIAENLEFTANWDKDVFKKLNEAEGLQKCEFSLSDGTKITWDGYISASNSEGGVNEVVEMTISVTPTTVPVVSIA